MEVSNQLKNQHLLWRAGFGPALEQLNDLAKNTPESYYKMLAKTSEKDPQYINVASQELLDLYDNLLHRDKSKKPDEAERRKINRMQQDSIKKLNLSWLSEMTTTPAQLREKMAFFWHGHFASRNRNVIYNEVLLNVFRKYGLSDFGTLLTEVSRSASMLYFLNNQQNRKGKPNENFAREVMELFTLGRGNYTEKDVKEAARAFTGWTADGKGTFVFRPKFHDDGKKIVLGKTGNFNGQDILNILLEKKQTAKFITQKIYSFFVNDKVDNEIVDQLAEKFYNSKYDIAALMKTIFTSTWFYDLKNIGTRIKSPVELLVGIQRTIPMEIGNENILFNLQKILGQQLLYPPNVAGWPGGQAWIDSSTLMMRLRTPQMFNDKDELNVTPKQDDDVMMGLKAGETPAVPKTQTKKIQNKKYAVTINAKINWLQYTEKYNKIKKEDLLSAIKKNLFQLNTMKVQDAIIKNIDDSSRVAYIKSATIQLMSTPEYQLC